MTVEKNMAQQQTAGLRQFLPWRAALMAVLLALALPAWAALGEQQTSIQADQAHMRAALRIINAGTHTVHELQAPNGPTVREYVSASGKVFAIAWQGPSHPDFRQLLGSYYDQFQQALEQRERRGHGPVNIQLPGLVFQSGGHMGALSGRAYLPDQLPAGLRAESIR